MTTLANYAEERQIIEQFLAGATAERILLVRTVSNAIVTISPNKVRRIGAAPARKLQHGDHGTTGTRNPLQAQLEEQRPPWISVHSVLKRVTRPEPGALSL